ncbi:MAG: hypothetical protein ACRES3_11850 [Steroidobacteraceae bacterium]
MAFNLSHWLLRRRIDAQVRMPGQAMEHRRIANPYHAVSIELGERVCKAAEDLDDHRFLADEAPMLPLAGCTLTKCQCRYMHYSDRRSRRDRRMHQHNPYAHKMNDRRTGTGRRITD